ncbi:SUN domain-containing protein 3-like isoform X1 [Cyrtonyx montezumae]|uniref:SUN domain-containing protein 3-like isoform X1 n=1 Tax=Cyrtonyx montezumae TaxID=9017 RepID=UPI0032DAB769
MNHPDSILQPSISPGKCWPMEGYQGQVVITLPAEILPTCVTVQHIFKKTSPSGTVSSAPKDVAVLGLDVDREEEVLLGSFTFDVEKEPIQTFLLKVRCVHGDSMPGRTPAMCPSLCPQMPAAPLHGALRFHGCALPLSGAP